MFPNRKIKFIVIDKTLEDVQKRKQSIQALMFPKETHMDFNISTALNIATKQEGRAIVISTFMIFMDEYFQQLIKKLDTESLVNIYKAGCEYKKLFK